MVIHLLLVLYLSIATEAFPFFWDILDDSFKLPLLYLFLLAVLMSLNFYLFVWKEPFNNNKDILYRCANFCFRAVSIFFTLLLSEIKKFVLFLKKFKYREAINTHLVWFTLKVGVIFIIWRPLFRKWSYFGFYKTNRSKWWKNK